MASLEIPESEWHETGAVGDRSHLLAAITVNNLDFHVEAFEVNDLDPFGQVAAQKYHDEAFERWSAAASPDGPFETVSIGGRNYVLFMSPFC